MPKCVFSTVNDLEVGMVKCALDENNIVNFLENYHMNALKGASWAAPFAGMNTTIGNINVIVKDEDVDKALEIINSLFGNNEDENIQYSEKEDLEENTEIIINSIPKKRHNFTTFWLIFTLIVKILLFIGYINILLFDNNRISNLLIYFHNSDINTIQTIFRIYIIFFLFGTLGIIFLLKWKKIGYWMFFIECIGFSTILYIINNGIFPFIMLFLNIGIIIPMFLILHLKRNGITTWEQMR